MRPVKEALQTLLLILVGMHDQGPVLMIQILRNMKQLKVSRISSRMVALPELLAPKLLQCGSTSDTSTLALPCWHNYLAVANFQHLVADTA